MFGLQSENPVLDSLSVNHIPSSLLINTHSLPCTPVGGITRLPVRQKLAGMA